MIRAGPAFPLTGSVRAWASRAWAGLKPIGPGRAQSGPRAPGFLEMPIILVVTVLSNDPLLWNMQA